MFPSHKRCVSDQDLLSWLLCFSRHSHRAVHFKFILRQFISLNACGSGALLHAHPTCCVRICCRAVVLKLDCTFETSDTFLRLSVVCLSLYKCRFNYVGGKVSLSRDVSQMTRKCSQIGSDCYGIMCSYSSSWALWMVIYILEFTRQPPQKSSLNSDEQCIFREELTFLKINEVMIYKILLYELDMPLMLRLFF